MSDENNRIGPRTGGNANLLSILGDLLSSDGVQTMRVPLGAPNQFLSVDLTAECGLSWKAAGAAGALTFDEGVTLTVANVTNDLVTGTAVDQVDIVVNGVGGDIDMSADDGHIAMSTNGAGAISLATPGGGQILLTATGEDIGLSTVTAGDITLSAARHVELVTINGDVTIAPSEGGGFDGDINLNAAPGNGQVNITGLGLVGTLTGAIQIAAGASGSLVVADAMTIRSTTDDVTAEAGTVDGTGTVHIQPGTTSATRKFRVFNGAGAGRQTVLSPTGGGTVDTECRAKLDELLTALFNWGWLSQPNP